VNKDHQEAAANATKSSRLAVALRWAARISGRITHFGFPPGLVEEGLLAVHDGPGSPFLSAHPWQKSPASSLIL
jgi:hypothetical protein